MSNDVLLQETKNVVLAGKITAEKTKKTIELLRHAIAKKETPPVLYINSGGGKVVPSLELYHFLRDQETVTGIAGGACHSMALVVLQGCHIRKAHHYTRFTIHDIITTIEGSVWQMERGISKVIEARKKVQWKVYATLAERAGKHLEEIAKISQQTTSMSASEALAYGLIDEII